jgi:thiol-disulfide isomerase/thioredoxin
MSLPLPAFLVGALIAASLATPSASPTPESQAKHLTKIHSKMYGAYWCPHCQAQLTMFGKEASQLLDLTECDASGKDAKPELCKKEKVMGYPTWIIKNRRYSGTQSLTALANASRYLGPRKFINPDQK